MKSINLPREIKEVFYLFSDKEQEIIANYKDTVHSNSNLIEQATFLRLIYDNSQEHSAYFMYAFGRILHYCYKIEELKELYEKTLSAEIGLWYAYSLFLSSEYKEGNMILEKIKEQSLAPCMSLLPCLIHSHQLLYLRNKDEFNNYIDSCVNNSLFSEYKNASQCRVLCKQLLTSILLIKAFFEFDNNDINFAREFLPILDNMNKSLDDRINHAYLLYFSALIELKSNNFVSSHQLFLKVSAIVDNLIEPRLYLMNKMGIGDLFMAMGHVEDAMGYYEECKTKLELQFPKDKSLRGTLLSKISYYYFITGNKEKAEEAMKTAIKLLKECNFYPISLLLSYVELLIKNNKIELAEKELLKILNLKDKLLPIHKANALYLESFIELRKNNLGLANDLVHKALMLSDNIGDEFTSSKALVLLLIIFLIKYNLAMKLEDLIEADKCVDDIITFLEEKAKYRELSRIYLIRAKIKLRFFDYETVLIILNKGKQYAIEYEPDIVYLYDNLIDLVQEIMKNKEKEAILEKIDFKKEVNTIFNILIKQTDKLGSPIETIAVAVLIFHSSGIPISTYRSQELHISDDMIFGGFVSAISHLLDEIFIEENTKSLRVDHGQYKLLIEFYMKRFSVVVVSFRDSFLLRRKMHQLVNYIAIKDVFKERFYGELDELILRDIDNYVERLFNVKKD